MFMYQGTSHPRSLIPVDRAESKDFIFLIKNQFVRNGEQNPNLGEFRDVLVPSWTHRK